MFTPLGLDDDEIDQHNIIHTMSSLMSAWNLSKRCLWSPLVWC